MAVGVLLQAGAAVEVTDSEGHTPLHGAAFNGQAAAIVALLRGGAAPDAERAGVTRP